MNIPLIQDNQKDSINASLIAIKREEERLQALIAEADKKIAQLNELKVSKSDIVDEVTLNNMQSVTSNAVYESVAKVTSVTGGRVISFPNGLKILAVKIDWTGDTGVSYLGAATVAYSVRTYNYPSAFNVSNIYSASATSIDVGSGVPNASIETISTSQIQVCDYGYNRTSASSSASHSVYVIVIGK